VLFGSVLSGIGAYLSVRFLTRYFANRSLRPFGIYCLVVIVCVLIKGFLSFMARWTLIGVSRDIEFDIRNDLLKRLLLLEKFPRTAVFLLVHGSMRILMCGSATLKMYKRGNFCGMRAKRMRARKNQWRKGARTHRPKPG